MLVSQFNEKNRKWFWTLFLKGYLYRVRSEGLLRNLYFEMHNYCWYLNNSWMIGGSSTKAREVECFLTFELGGNTKMPKTIFLFMMWVEWVIQNPRPWHSYFPNVLNRSGGILQVLDVWRLFIGMYGPTWWHVQGDDLVLEHSSKYYDESFLSLLFINRCLLLYF